jgi:hypothetical protein
MVTGQELALDARISDDSASRGRGAPVPSRHIASKEVGCPKLVPPRTLDSRLDRMPEDHRLPETIG